jgi:hypothetical protein
MLSIPYKRGNPCNVLQAIKNFICSEFPDYQTQKFDLDSREFQSLRDNAVLDSLDPTDLSLAKLLRYSSHISSLVIRFSSYEVKFSFAWLESFRPSKPFISNSLYFEWACVLWNIGMLL